VPLLRQLYQIKGRFKRIFDTAQGRRQAAYQCVLPASLHESSRLIC
jgi:hypothetical protein